MVVKVSSKKKYLSAFFISPFRQKQILHKAKFTINNGWENNCCSSMHPLHCTFDAGSLFLNVFLFIQARTMGLVLLAFIGNFSALLKIELKLDFCISSRVIFGATRDRTYTTSSQSPLISDPFPSLVINFIMWAFGFTS